MRELFEISDRYIEPGDANELLYEPLEGGVTYRSTRRYEVEFDGEKMALEAFVKKTLFDPISQEFHEGEDSAFEDYSFVLEFGMKPGALDLEKEAILTYYRGIKNLGFELKSLTIRQRIYLFGAKLEDPDRFIRDICNAAIHNWSVITAG